MVVAILFQLRVVWYVHTCKLLGPYFCLVLPTNSNNIYTNFVYCSSSHMSAWAATRSRSMLTLVGTHLSL